MILSTSYRIPKIINKKIFISNELIKNNSNIQKIYINNNLIKNNNELNINKFLKLNKKYLNYKFLKKQKFYCINKLEKMSKSKSNIITQDHICTKYGIDAFRMYLMFLGPINKDKT